MNRLIPNTAVVLFGILVGASAYALGPPGSAYNGGTGIGVDNFYDQLRTKPAAQQNEQQTKRVQKADVDKYPRYVNVTKIPVSFSPDKP
jgi:hypothetical protein